MRDIFPRARQILHGEFYYRSRGADVGFDPEFGELTLAEQFRVSAKNATMALALAEADGIVCPTPFQASMLPDIFRSRVKIIHEGIDPARAVRKAQVRLQLTKELILDGSAPVVTFINRRFEPLRGFHVFMRALSKVLAAVPNAHAFLVGMDEPGGYGPAAPEGTTWKQQLLSEVGGRLDPSRVHFPGWVPYDELIAALSISTAHVYYTYPFVLSWSLLDAMACECLVIGSDTAPVRDVVHDQVNGRLLNFFDVDALADTLIEACRNPRSCAPLRKEARATVLSRFDRAKLCQPAWLRLIDEVK